MTEETTKTLPELITELKDELKAFFATRIAMLQAELGEKVESLKMAAPAMLIGLSLVLTSWLVFTAFLISAIANGFESGPWRYVISLLIVALLYSIAGAVALTIGWRQIKQKSMKPERTLRILKEDQLWMQKEAKTQ